MRGPPSHLQRSGQSAMTKCTRGWHMHAPSETNAYRNIETATRRGVYHGWLVVGAAFIVALFGWGIGFYGPGIYLVALQQRHGWSTAEISSAITAYYLLGATLILFCRRRIRVPRSAAHCL